MLPKFLGNLFARAPERTEIPAIDEFEYFGDGNWEADLPYHGGRTRLRLSIEAGENGPSREYIDKCTAVVARMSEFEAAARTALESDTCAKHLNPSRFSFEGVAFAEAPVSFRLTFSHPDDPEGAYSALYSNGKLYGVVRDD